MLLCHIERRWRGKALSLAKKVSIRWRALYSSLPLSRCTVRLALGGIAARLDRLAAKTGRTKAFYLREFIESGIGEMEDYDMAAETLARVRKGKERVSSAAEVRSDLGLDD